MKTTINFIKTNSDIWKKKKIIHTFAHVTMKLVIKGDWGVFTLWILSLFYVAVLILLSVDRLTTVIGYFFSSLCLSFVVVTRGRRSSMMWTCSQGLPRLCLTVQPLMFECMWKECALLLMVQLKWNCSPALWSQIKRKTMLGLFYQDNIINLNHPQYEYDTNKSVGGWKNLCHKRCSNFSLCHDWETSLTKLNCVNHMQRVAHSLLHPMSKFLLILPTCMQTTQSHNLVND